MIICGRPDRLGNDWRLLEKVLQTRCVQQPARTVSSTVPGVTEPDVTGPCPAAIGPYTARPHAGQVVRRVLLRRNIVDAETAPLVAAAVQAALQSGAPSRPPRRGAHVPTAGCEPLFW
jgi:hypothetical protein